MFFFDTSQKNIASGRVILVYNRRIDTVSAILELFRFFKTEYSSNESRDHTLKSTSPLIFPKLTFV